MTRWPAATRSSTPQTGSSKAKQSSLCPRLGLMDQQDGQANDGFTLVTSTSRRRRVKNEQKEGKSNSNGAHRGGIAAKANGKSRTNSAQKALAQGDHVELEDATPSEAEIDRMRKSVAAHRSSLRQGKLGEATRACFQQFTNMLYRRVELQGKEKAASDAESDGTAAASTSRAPSPATSRADVLPRTVYALGMGSVSSNRTAQIQLAFLLELQDHLKTEIQRSTGHRHPPSTATSEESPASRAEALAVSDLVDIHSYDPLSSLADNALLTAFGVRTSTTITANDIGPLTRPTLLYMPHCPRPLYDSYLTASFTLTHLSNAVLCANRLSRYAEFLPAERLSREMPAVCRVLPYLDTVDVPNDPDGSLSDLAFQVFNADKSTVQQRSSQVENPKQGTTEHGKFQQSRSSKRHKKKQGDAAVPESARLTPHDGDFWTLPLREASDADAEVL